MTSDPARIFALALVLFFSAGCHSEQPLEGRASGRSVADRVGLTYHARVARIHDGDSFIAVKEGGARVRIRLGGIDAPERGQAHAQAARRELERLIGNRSVTVEPRKIDRYGRTVAVVRIDDTDAGLEMITRGLAWHYTFYAHEQTGEERWRYRSAEAAARQASRGLWRDRSPVPPWQYRRRR